LASRCALACAYSVGQEVANDVRPPITVPASAAKADMYAASIEVRHPGIALSNILAETRQIPGGFQARIVSLPG